MALAHQLLDLLVAGLLAGIVTFVLLPIVGQTGFTVALVLSCLYYFSRNPFGSSPERGVEYNEYIDDLYDRVLP
ncbi:hypothetical protein [Halomarina oriensis]|uniref:Uncharacterized protein n=1 Tax=Halomarina oriensis TaxID=671145 RepID=A0A6B0GSH2_9EURY|nr:hypothetical protein [Halomarina oriensis]MWG35583.1 hypothetical protein [Halomarina oriensis]